MNETSSTTGTVAYTLSGSPPAGTSYFTFRQSYANGNDKVCYFVVSKTSGKWEKNRFGTLTYGTRNDTLSRNVMESSNGGAPILWVGDDLPLLVYVVPDSDAQDFATAGAPRRPGLRPPRRRIPPSLTTTPAPAVERLSGVWVQVAVQGLAALVGDTAPIRRRVTVPGIPVFIAWQRIEGDIECAEIPHPPRADRFGPGIEPAATISSNFVTLTPM